MAEPHEPATPFWQGYKRSPEVTAQLIAALSTALYTYDTMRFGQLIANLVHDDNLFGMYDEELLSRIENPWWVT